MFSFGIVLAWLANRVIPKASSPPIEDPLERFSSGIAKTKKIFSVDSLKRSPPEERSQTFFIKRFLFNFWDHIPTQEWRDTFHVHGSQLITENNSYCRWDTFQKAISGSAHSLLGKKLRRKLNLPVTAGKTLSRKLGKKVKAL